MIGVRRSVAVVSGPPTPRRPGWWRVLAVLLLSVAAVLALTVAGANLALAFGVPKLFEKTDEVDVKFRRAWTFWPTTVHLRDVRFLFVDHNVQVSIDLSRAVVDLRLRELFSRTFHATRLEGEGVRFRFRHRISPESASRPWVGAGRR